MAQNPALTTPPEPPALAEGEIAVARAYVEASRAASTQRAYATDWRQISAWCHARAAEPLPAAPALVAVYLSSLADRGLAPPSIARALAAIAHMHKRAGHLPSHRTADARASGNVIADIVMRLLWSIQGDGLPARRDRALISLGMALAARRSELVALNVEDLAWKPKSLRVTILRSKTDQDGQGVVVAVPEGSRLTPLIFLRGRSSGRSGKAGASTLPGYPVTPSPASSRPAPLRLRPRRPPVRRPCR